MDQLKKRNEQKTDCLWELSHIVENDAQWEETAQEVEKEITRFQEFKGTLTKPEKTLQCLQEYEALYTKLEKLYAYAHMHWHEDSRIDHYQALADRSEALHAKASEHTAFVTVELKNIPEEEILDWLKNQPALSNYKHFLLDIQRQKHHILSQEMEELLAKSQEATSGYDTVFSMFNNADIAYTPIQDENGNTVALTKGRYQLFLENKNREVRKQAFQSMHQSYMVMKNTLAANYSASVKRNIFYAQARKFPSALQASLADDNIPPQVYGKLIETVHKNIPSLHRYMDLRQRVLDVDTLYPYDLYTPIVPKADTKITFDKAKETVKKALAPLGDEYLTHLETAFQNRWIDVYENEGKRSGAYSWGVYGVHPYVLLNWEDNINSMFTLAHEMGHAMHSYYSYKNQTYINGGHSIFVAEVASTVNEALLMEYLLKTEQDDTMRQYLVNYFLEQFRGTLFRQTMFAEFEKTAHEQAEKGQSLTSDFLMAIYEELNKTYYGPRLTIDPLLPVEWARIPHFYTAFYVYQYATGYSAAISLTDRILNHQGVQDYLAFLKSGCSLYSIDLLKLAGVDMTQSGPVQKALQKFDGLVTEMDALLTQ